MILIVTTTSLYGLQRIASALQSTLKMVAEFKLLRIRSRSIGTVATEANVCVHSICRDMFLHLSNKYSPPQHIFLKFWFRIIYQSLSKYLRIYIYIIGTLYIYTLSQNYSNTKIILMLLSEDRSNAMNSLFLLNYTCELTEGIGSGSIVIVTISWIFLQFFHGF